MLILLRRIHLYAGLFLLPWVFLYGITGAMYNHLGLMPEVEFRSVSASQLQQTSLAEFPTPASLAAAVVKAIQAAAPKSNIELNEDHPPEFVNDVILKASENETQHAIHIHPVDKSAWIASGTSKANPRSLLPKVNNVDVDPDPYLLARETAPEILKAAGIQTEASIQPMGWSKLNFLARVDGQPARITYVLRDGHVDITEYNGEPDMSLRQFFMRLHTTHGQSPHWNGRMIWSVVIDIMAIAMVSWGITGIVMWWQIKRTRIVGTCVIGLSIATAAVTYFAVADFYATSKL